MPKSRIFPTINTSWSACHRASMFLPEKKKLFVITNNMSMGRKPLNLDLVIALVSF
jgi:hypothetical protein